jgi:hypothetical protein
MLSLILTIALAVAPSSRVANVSLGDDPVANRQALQDAHNSLLANVPPGGKVALPSGDYQVSGKVRVWCDWTCWEGEGREATGLQQVGNRHDPIFEVGLPPVPVGKALTPDHFPLAPDGLFDSTVAQGHVGFRTFGASHLSQQAGPFCYGTRQDYWGRTKVLTIESVLDLSRIDKAKEAVCLFGASKNGVPAPYKLWWTGIAGGGTSYHFDFQTADGKVWSVPIPCQATAPEKLTVTVDLVNAKVGAWLNQTQVKLPELGPKFAASSALGFAPNKSIPFNLGISGLSVVNADGWNGAPDDWTCYGLAFYNSAPYADDGAGKPQRRLDGGAVNDARFFNAGRMDCICLIPFVDDPARAAANRCVVEQTGNAAAYTQGSLSVIDNDPIQALKATTKGFTLRGLTLRGIRTTDRPSNWLGCCTLGSRISTWAVASPWGW